MRLIDADELIELTIKDRDYAAENAFMDMFYERQHLIDVINKQPTAYDVDAVVAQLEELTEEECILHECGIRSERCKPCIAKKAIEIVKGR